MASVEDIDWRTLSLRSADAADCSFPDNSFLDSSSVNGDVFSTETEDVDVENEIDSFLRKINAQGVFCPIMAMREPFAKFFIEDTPEDLLRKVPTDDVEFNISVIYFCHRDSTKLMNSFHLRIYAK